MFDVVQHLDLVSHLSDVFKAALGYLLVHLLYNVILAARIKFYHQVKVEQDQGQKNKYSIGIRNSSRLSRLMGQTFQKVHISARVQFIRRDPINNKPTVQYADVPVERATGGYVLPVLTPPEFGAAFRWFTLNWYQSDQIIDFLRAENASTFSEGSVSLEDILKRSGATLDITIFATDSLSGRELMFAQSYIYDTVNECIIKGDAGSFDLAKQRI